MSSLVLLKSMLFANALQKKPRVLKKAKKIKKIPKKKSKVSSTMCRICDQEEGDIPIFDNFLHPNIPADILHFTGVSMDKTDDLSQNMCQNCLHLLNGCIMFKEICQKTNKKLVEKAIKKEFNFNSESNTDLVESYNDTCPPDKNDESGEDIILFEDYSDGSCGQDDLEMATLSPIKKSKKLPKQEKANEEKRRFLCDVCGKTAHSNANLLAHLLIHEQIFPFKCEQCPYMGRTMDLLKVHQRTHLSEKPFKCPQCSKTTTTASNLAKHVRHVHSSSKPYKCSYCDKAFSFQHDVKRHIKDIHLRQGTVECYICFKKFNTRKILRGHQWKVHKIKGERQGRLPAYLQWQMEEQNENHNNKYTTLVKATFTPRMHIMMFMEIYFMWKQNKVTRDLHSTLTWLNSKQPCHKKS